MFDYELSGWGSNLVAVTKTLSIFILRKETGEKNSEFVVELNQSSFKFLALFLMIRKLLR